MRFSEAINELATALAKAQADFGPLVKGKPNQHFKSMYADLASVLDVVRVPLAENGLAVVQGVADGSLVTRLMHTSGQWAEACYPLSVDARGGSASQAVGSALTYARRYSLQALLGLAAEDDDGEAASGRPKQAQREEPPAEKPASAKPAARAADKSRLVELAKASGLPVAPVAIYLCARQDGVGASTEDAATWLNSLDDKAHAAIMAPKGDRKSMGAVLAERAEFLRTLDDAGWSEWWASLSPKRASAAKKAAKRLGLTMGEIEGDGVARFGVALVVLGED